MQPRPPVMLFAAGLGTRMAPLTDNLPKPLIKVGGKPLIDHALDLIDAAGLHQIIANTHYKPDLLEQHLALRNVGCVREVEILETGGGLKNALPLLGSGPVVTMNTDSVWTGPNPVKQLLTAWQPEFMDALLVVIPRKNAVGHKGAGDFDMDAIGRLIRAPGLVYSGLQILKPGRLAQITDQKFSLNVIWDMMATDGRLFGLPFEGRWCDVGQPDCIPLAETMLRPANV